MIEVFATFRVGKWGCVPVCMCDLLIVWVVINMVEVFATFRVGKWGCVCVPVTSMCNVWYLWFVNCVSSYKYGWSLCYTSMCNVSYLWFVNCVSGYKYGWSLCYIQSGQVRVCVCTSMCNEWNETVHHSGPSDCHKQCTFQYIKQTFSKAIPPPPPPNSTKQNVLWKWK